MEEHIYPQMYRVEKEHWWFVARNRILLRYIETRLHPESSFRVLDVGCGTGAMLEEFSRKYQAWGIDFSAQAIDFCRKRGLTNARVGSLDVFPRDERFDMVTMFDVVEHVDDHDGLLREAYHRLADGGHILIAVPAFQWLWSDHDTVLHHKRRYTRATLGRVVRGAGFAVEHMTHFNTLLFPAAALRRIAAKIFRLHSANDLDIPSPAMNALLRSIFSLEEPVVPHVSMPFGLSLLCLGKKVAP